jgi:small subunit ribosomal protein S2
MSDIEQLKSNTMDELLKVGAHFGFSKSRRHPSASQYIFGSKNRVDLFDLEKTSTCFGNALDFVRKLSEEKGVILFVGGKHEAQKTIKETAESVSMPYVASRWIGGTLTNFSEIRKRVETMIDLESQKEKGELSKYTKKERLLIDRKIEKLEKMFGGIRNMTNLPKALFIVDPRYEKTALSEAKTMKIPVIALCGSDNNVKDSDFPIPANDSSIASIKYFVVKIGEAYKR